MTRPRVALFTPFNPNTGGGAVIFRSLLANLQEADVRWFYLADSKIDLPNSTHLGPTVLGGSLVADALASARLYVVQSHPEIDRYAAAIREWLPDIVWVNAMNEGLLLGKKLREAGVRLHVSVHDDPAGLAIKSKRYRHLASIIESRNRALLKIASSVDVVCQPMQKYYMDRYGVNSEVVYRYIQNRLDDRLDAPKPVATMAAASSTIVIGHVGSVYSKPEVVAFLAALRSIQETDGVRFKVITFGKSKIFDDAADEVPGIVEGAGEVREAEAVERLQQCRFLYSMYSFSPRHRIFRETSQPTKISTYLMAAKPILAHCPAGSSTIAMLSKFKLGVCVTSLEAKELIDGVRGVLNFKLETAEVRRAIDHYCGRTNLDYLEKCFDLEDAAAVR